VAAIGIVIFSSDGKMLATRSSDGTAHIWDLEGKEIAKLVGHQGDVYSVVFSPNGKRLATRGSDLTARMRGYAPTSLLIPMFLRATNTCVTSSKKKSWIDYSDLWGAAFVLLSFVFA